MRTSLIVVAATLQLACSTPELSHHDVLMDQIEQQVKLPDGARQLKDYARYYANGERGEIEAIYLIPFDDELQPGENCTEMLENFASKDVPCPDLKSPFDLRGGQRRWVQDRERLPAISDGGCGIVNIRFDPSTNRVKEAACNGVA